MSDISFYPPPLRPGSNAFGQFEFGVSPFGTLSPFNWLLTVISQYANSPTLLQVLENFAQAMDQTENFDAFYGNIWDIATAQGYGLDVWGRIVGVSRNLTVSTGQYFGFEQEETADVFGPGGQSPFYVGEPITSTYALTDMAYRQLILAKAAANICDGSIPAINNIMMNLFGASGDCYVTDNGNMTMTYTFRFKPTPIQESIIYESGVLPKPVGVAATIVISP